MKTIAISIDEATLRQVDRIAREVDRTESHKAGDDRRIGRRPKRHANRSKVIREALREYVARRTRAEREAAEHSAYKRHGKRLGRELAALVREQAKP